MICKYEKKEKGNEKPQFWTKFIITNSQKYIKWKYAYPATMGTAGSLVVAPTTASAYVGLDSNPEIIIFVLNSY